MQSSRLALAILVVALGVWALVSPPPRARAVGATTVQIMPSSAAGGTNYGIHYDDGALTARDFSHSNSAWLRGMLYANGLNVPIRYMYWDAGNCRVRGRLQKYVFGVWSDDYHYDVDILHLNNPPAYTSYTQTVYFAGDWFYKEVGTASTCGTPRAHSHLGMIVSTYVSRAYGGSDDTCWANNQECMTMPALPRKHAPRASTGPGCPGPWMSQYAVAGYPDYKKSGRTDGPNHDPYACEDWSGFSWGSDTPVFTGTL